MARTQTSEQHRAGQAALVAGIPALIAHAWATLLDPHDLKGSSPKLAATVQAILSQYGRGSAAAALSAYRRQRREAGVLGRVNLPMPEQPAEALVRGVVEKALSPLYGPVTPETLQAAEADLSEQVSQLVLQQGREATITAVDADAEAKGWARVAEPGACAFCAMLATRGAVYKTAEAAGEDFQYHDNCRCHVEPVFNAYEPTAQIRQWQSAYQRLKDENGGKLSLIQWRRAFEGRDGTDRPPLG